MVEDQSMIRGAVDIALEAPAPVLEAMFQAVYAWRESRDVTLLEEFADAIVSTIEVHSSPEYEKALAMAPTAATHRGRDPQEIFTAHGF